MKKRKFYTPEDCRRKADQHWEMAGLARQDGDTTDANRHTQEARLWEARASEGFWEPRDEQYCCAQTRETDVTFD